MGKSPGKWIKSILGGKNSSKSNLSKGKDTSKSARKEEVLGTAKAPVSELTVDPSLVLPLASGFGAKNGVDTECEAGDDLPTEGVTKDENAKEITILGSLEDANSIRHEKAATKAQAAVRGYLARRAFRTLKSIIRLQAVIRGHLVRRQAVATLYSVQAIIKFQAVARGKIVRCSTVGIEVQNTCNLAKLQGVKCLDSSMKFFSTLGEQLIQNVIARKLLGSSLSPKPLRLQYGLGEPNSTWEWLERWTRVHFQVYHSQPKKNVDSKSQTKHNSSQGVGTEHVRPKRNVRKLENGSKQNVRKLSNHQSNSVQEHPRTELEKVKLNRRKTSDSRKETGEGFEVDNGKTKRSVRKGSATATNEVSEQGNNDSVEKMKDVAVSVLKPSGPVASVKLPAVDKQVGSLNDHPHFDLQPVDNNGKVDDIHELNSKDQSTSTENQKISERRDSFPPTIEHQESGILTTPKQAKLPSYMSSTESARAKLKGQGSQRFPQDEIEKKAIGRRHSLPSSTNGIFTTMSPRAQKLVQMAGNGAIRVDGSLSSSRDGIVSDRMTKPEWRR